MIQPIGSRLIVEPKLVEDKTAGYIQFFKQFPL